MKLEFHQLDRRYEHLRALKPQRQRSLLASLVESGQQTPIVVVAVSQQAHRYIVIDGYKRIRVLEQLGRDTVEAVEWPMNETDALLLERSMRFSEPDSALEQGWLLMEFHRRFGMSLDELARRFDRSRSWVTRRVALAGILPAGVQDKVRSGEIAAETAMNVLVPMARSHVEDCQRMAEAIARHRFTTRQASRLYAAWRQSRTPARQRILEHPLLFLKTEQAAIPAASTPAAADLAHDLDMICAISRRAERKLSRAAPAMSAAELDETRKTIQRAIAQLEQLGARIETETGHADEIPTHDDSGTEPAENADPRNCADDESLPQKRAACLAVSIGGSPARGAPGESGAFPPGDHRVVDAHEGQPDAGP